MRVLHAREIDEEVESNSKGCVQRQTHVMTNKIGDEGVGMKVSSRGASRRGESRENKKLKGIERVSASHERG